MSSPAKSSKKERKPPPLKRPKSCCSSISSDGIETHRVVTEDGFILSLFHITPLEMEESGPHPPRVPVLLIPGLFNSGTDWIEAFEDETKSLPYKLIHEGGLDCWMGCVRGTPNSKEHVSLKNTSKKFWDFSLDEMSRFDIPSFIDYILKATQSNDLFYVGFSMGGAIIMASLIERPEYASKVRMIAALCPGTYGHHLSTKFNKVIIPVGAQLRRMKFIYKRPVGTKSVSEMLKALLPSCCCRKVKRESLGGWIIKATGKLSGPVASKCGTDREMYNRIAEILPASTSLKHVSHVAQCFTSKKFRKFNYGRAGNIKKYGQSKPPTYDLGKVFVPVATWSSSHDFLVPAQDVAQTAKELPNLISHRQISETRFSHCDFLFGRDADKLVYDEIVQAFNKYSSTKDMSILTEKEAKDEAIPSPKEAEAVASSQPNEEEKESTCS